MHVISPAGNHSLATTEIVEGSQRTGGNTKPSDALRLILAGEASGGAVLMGPAGSGRRAAFDEAIAQLDPQTQVVHLNGSPYAARMRHGVLSFLLSQLDTNPSATRHELVHGLAQLVCKDGRRTIVTLGSPDMVDQESAAILAQLAAMKKIRLVAVCSRFAELPNDVLALYRSGQLDRVTVHSMDVVQTRSYLEAELGGPISMFAAAALWHLSHSNRDLLHQIVREMVADGKLKLEGDCWIFAPGALRMGPALKAQGVRALAGLEPAERRLLSLLALGGPVASENLRRSGLAADLAGLRARGLVTVGEEPLGTVSITVPFMGHMLRELSDEDMRQELEEVFASLHDDPLSARVLTEVRAMLELGNCEATVAIAEEFADAGGFSVTSWLKDAGQQIRILEAEVKALCILGRLEDAEASLAWADMGVAEALKAAPRDSQLIQAGQLLRVMKATVALEEGRPEAIGTILSTTEQMSEPSERSGAPDLDGPAAGVRPVEGAVVGALWATETLHFRALAVQAEAWALTSRQQEALVVVQRVMADIEGLRLTGILDQIMSPAEGAVIECTLLRVQLLSGEWHAAATAARGLAEGQYADAHAIAYGELVRGILAGLAGESDSALGPLLPTLRQFAIDADATELAAAGAAAAYCLADQDRDPEAVELLLRTPSVLDRMLPLNFFTWSSEIFSSLAVARLDTPQAAIVRLMALADKARRCGSTVLEMNTLAMALRFGHTEAASRLEAVSESNPGRAARAFSLLARGVTTADAHLLADGLEALVAHGQVLYVGEDSNVLLSALSHKERRRVFAAVTRLRHVDGAGSDAVRQTAAAGDEGPVWLEQLTKREAQIAQRVISGMTNTAIARMSGVSVRTVEGHLYQVYSKLQVRNRQELTALDRASRRMVGVR